MEFLAASTILGTLEVLEIYIQYNGARLLACKNQASQIFLALWVDEEDDYDLWLYMLVSLDRLQSIRTGQISLHQAFCEPESSLLYELTYSYIHSEWSTKKVALEDLDKDFLPLEGTFLECDPETLPVISSQKVIKNAISKTREFVNLVLQPPSNRYPNEFPVSGLGGILAAFQPLIDQLSIGANKDFGFGIKEITKKSTFNMLAASVGSFQVELASSVFEADLFGNSVLGNATNQLFDLIRIGSNADELQKFLLEANEKTSNKKTAKKYSIFLESLVSSGSGIKIEWGSPTINRGGNIEASFSSIQETLKIIKKIESLETKQFEIIGRLFKVDTENWKFGITELIDRTAYKGDILEEAKPDARIARISDIYTALICEIPEIAPTTNDIKIQYKLLALNAYEPPNNLFNLLES